jgi:hypothetical protein
MMAFISSFLTPAFGTVTVRTPFSSPAFTWSALAFSSKLNHLMNLPLLAVPLVLLVFLPLAALATDEEHIDFFHLWLLPPFHTGELCYSLR